MITGAYAHSVTHRTIAPADMLHAIVPLLRCLEK